MDISKVKNDIKTGEFDNFYIFAGDEGYIIKTYINMIAKKTGFNLNYVDSVTEVYSKLKVKSLVPTHSIYVVLDDKEFLNSKYEARWDNVTSDIKDDILIVQYTSVDKRVKFWKHFKDKAVMFDSLNNRLLTKYIQKHVDLNESDCEKLIEVCEKSLGRILLEVDKIEHYPSKDKHSTIFKKLLNDGTIYQPPKDAIFDLVAAVMDKDVELSYDLLANCKAVGEASLVILSVLYTNFLNLLQVQSCTSGIIIKSTGLTGWQIKNVKPYCDVYGDEEIVDILRLLHSVEKGIKTGQITDEVSVDYVLATIFKEV